jgi:arylsulfatase A-like enzyme
VSAYDILPTTLSLLELPALRDSFGVDLTPLLLGRLADPRRLVVSQSTAGHGAGLRRLYACIQGNWKFHLTIGTEGTVARTLYDLGKDPDEKIDVAPLYPDVVADLEQAVQAHRLREAELAHSARGRPVDLRTMEQLRSLGYTLDDELTP